MNMRELTPQRLHELLHYSPDTGVFTWRVRRSGTAGVGSTAGTLDRGYIYIGIDRRIYPAHRLAWLYMTGSWPTNEIDHMDGEKTNNRISNLRDVCREINQQNLRKAHSRNSCGLLGVSLHRSTGKWRARLWTGGKNKSLGLFDSPEEAHSHYVAAKREIHIGGTL